MAAVQTTVSLGHALRKEHKLKVRQPLARAHVASSNARTLFFLQNQQHLIAEELNVKIVDFTADEGKLVRLKAKPNFRILGKKVGKWMKAAQQAITDLDQHKLAILLSGESLPIVLEGEQFVLTPEDVEVERVVHEGMIAANQGLITIALDTELSEELMSEGLAREIINKINSTRRELGLAVTDRIRITLETSERVETCFKEYGDYIQSEVLAVSVNFAPTNGTEWDLNGEPAKISIEKV